MKRILSLFLASALVIGSLAACKKEPEQEEPSSSAPTSSIYQDGTYRVKYAVPAWDRTQDYLTVTVAGDVFNIDEYGCRESETAESSSSEAADGSSATAAEQKAADHSQEILDLYEDLGKDLDAMQDAPVKDAEEHTYRFIRMMRTVEEFAKSGDTTPVELGQYADGDYEIVMPDFNDDGWKETVNVVVKDGLISSIDYNAKNESGSLITEDADLNKGDGDDVPAKYYPAVVKSYENSGYDLEQMGAPAGGGSATKEFKKLMKPLIASMTSGGRTELVGSRYVDGTYKAQFADFDEYGWKDTVTVKIQGGKVKVASFDAISKEDEKKKKSSDKDYAVQMKEKAGITPSDASDKLIEAFEKSGGDVLAIENVAGATISSNNFKLLVGQILATTAREGDNEEPLQVARMDAEDAQAPAA